MRKMTCFLAATLTFVAGCVTDAPIATEDGGRDSGTCNPECPAPGPGCHYEGGDCTSCGTRVCDDGGGASDGGPADGGTDGGGPCVECAAPPEGCHYEGASCATCGTLVCDVMCGGAGGTTFPDFDRSCTDTSECAVVEHQVDCCGSLRALGIRADEESAFDAAEATCRGMYPGCGCAGRPTEADDGTTSDGSAARVECVAGQCTSTFGLGDGDLCTPGGASCGAGLACCYPCGIPGCDYRCEPACDASDPGCVDGCFLRP